MKYIGPPDEILKPEIDYNVKTQKMAGKVFDGQNYKPDNRVMVWVTQSFVDTLWYKVLDSEADVQKYCTV